MALPPTGKIVARVMLPRACGCVREFQHYEVDKYRQARQAKFQRTRCPAFAAKVVEEKKQAPATPRNELLQQLPPGTRVTLTRAARPGMQAVAVELARLWVAARQKHKPAG
jgi:hypothetical protein